MRTTMACLLFACAIPGLQAGRLTVAVQVSAPNGLGFDLNPVGCGSAPGEVFLAFTSATAVCAGTTQIKIGPFTGLNFDAGGSAYAAAASDRLQASASINVAGAPHDGFHGGGANSSAEAITKNGFSVSNMTGMSMVQFKLAFSGNMSGSFDSFAGGRVTYDPLFFPVQNFILTNDTTDVVTQPLPMDLSKTFSYVLDLAVLAELCASCTPNTPSMLYSGSAQVDFSHTVQLVGMSITDLQGNPLIGLNINSLDGTDYNALLSAGVGPAVPEPATGAAGALALLAVVFKSLRRTRRNSPSRTDGDRPAAP